MNLFLGVMNLSVYAGGLLDFHNHSTNSDGSDTPTQLVERAKKHGITALALTDHNVFSGLKEFNYRCKLDGIFSIPFGVEIYAELPKEVLNQDKNGALDLILLGKNAKMQKFIIYQQILRNYRQRIWLPETFEALGKLGFFIPKFNFKKIAENVGTPNELFSFINEKNNLEILMNYVHSHEPNTIKKDLELNTKRFMSKYLYRIGCPAYIKRLQGFGVEDAVKLAEEMNCKAFIAHPGGEYGALSNSILNHCIQNKIHGIEVRNYFNTSQQNLKFDKLAERYNLIKSGGSDCHGENGQSKIGMYDRPQNQLPKCILEELLDNLS